MTNSMLYSNSIKITDEIYVAIPTVRQILNNESAYYNQVYAVLASPNDYMVQLDDAGIDFASISSYELFLWLFSGIAKIDDGLVLCGTDLSQFALMVNPQTGAAILKNPKTGSTIDRAVHGQICHTLRKIHNIEKDFRRPANLEAKKFMLERARIKQKRAAKGDHKSQLESLIVALVNTEQFKYNYESVLDLTIYQFNSSVHQIIHKINFDNTMIGCYAGTINAKELEPERLNWILTK